MKNPHTLLQRIEVRRAFVEQKLANYIISDSGCWEYQGQRTPSGYGMFSICVRDLKPYKKKCIASRVAYAFHNNEDPADSYVCHKCDNPCCINPEHLFIGTHQDNMDDMSGKGRRADQAGSNNAASKIGETEVREIIARIKEGETNTAIAHDFGITHSAVSSIRLCKTWQSVANDLDYKPLPVFKRKAS